MKKIKKWIMCFVLFTVCLLLKGVNANATTGHLGDGFDTGTLDTQTWMKSDGWTNGYPFNCTWRASNVNLDNGKMVLTLNKDTQGGSTPYAGGELRTNSMYSYGLYQANMKPAKNVGIVSSFFMYTGPSDNNPWDEIDIEFLGKDTTKVQFNYFTNGVGNHEYLYDLGYDASTSYHTYAFDWEKTYIAWYVDGKEVHRVTDNIPTHAGKIMMNLWPGVGVDGWLGYYDGVTPIKAYYDWMSYDSSSSTSISLDKSSLALTVGDDDKLTATTTPSSQAVTWKSSNESIATVDQSGNVTAKSAGTATITATITGTDTKATCTVSVSESQSTSDSAISLDKSSLNLTVGDKKYLSASTTTSSAVDITWESSDESVATVDEDGYVIAEGAGTCTITATIDGTSHEATCIVNVTKDSTSTSTTTPTTPTTDNSTTDGNLYIELEDGNVKNYSVSSDELSKFIQWYKDRDGDHSQSPIYTFSKGSYTDYVIHDKIVWFEVR